MKIHFIGCCGASMKVLRKFAEADGAETSGSDLMIGGHDARNVDGADVVVYSSAIDEDNPELVAARAQGIETIPRAAFLGKLAAGYETVIAVAGSHGKTTCTAMLGSIFSPQNASVHLGGEYAGESGRVGDKRLFITEACEYRRNFLYLRPAVSVVLNVELDHTDYYRDLADITAAFAEFSRRAPVRVLCGDDDNSAPLRKEGACVTFGLCEDCDVRAADIRTSREGSIFTLVRSGVPCSEIRLPVFGRHNVRNALAASAAAFAVGADVDAVQKGLQTFRGASRRMEFLRRIDGCDVFTDYAHHPHEIRSTLQALRDVGYARIGVVFQPHTYTRTRSLADEFVASLCAADEIKLFEIYAARELPIPGINAAWLCDKVRKAGRDATPYDDFDMLDAAVRADLSHLDAFVYMGAGDIDVAARRLAADA